MLKQGIIEPSFSDWSNPIVMIKKLNGEYRFCLDFGEVNKITKKDLYLIPLMNEILDTIELNKYEFGCSEIRYLSFKVNDKGLQIDDDKIEPILEFPKPKNIKQLQRLKGMASWYRMFIPHFAEMTEPLNRLLKRNKKWDWGMEQNEAFEKIKELLTSAFILNCSDFSQLF